MRSYIVLAPPDLASSLLASPSTSSAKCIPIPKVEEVKGERSDITDEDGNTPNASTLASVVRYVTASTESFMLDAVIVMDGVHLPCE